MVQSLPVIEMGSWHSQTDHEKYRQARDSGHRVVLQYGLRTFITYADVASILVDKKFRPPGPDWLIQRGVPDGPLFDWWNLFFHSQRGEQHRRYRTLLAQVLSSSLLEQIRTSVERRTAELCASLSDTGEVDLVADVCRKAPLEILCSSLGFDDTDFKKIGKYSADFGTVFAGIDKISPEVRAMLETAISTLSRLAKDAIRARSVSPRPDIISRLVAENDAALTEDEVTALVVNLIVGSYDTVPSLLACTIHALLSDPAHWRTISARPEMAAAAVEEANRHESCISIFPYVADEAANVGGVQIEASEMIILSILAANRDPHRFTQPDRFDIYRTNNKHLGMGLGPHYCAGASLSRALTCGTISALATSLPDMRLRDEEVSWNGTSELRAPRSLPVDLRPIPMSSHASAASPTTAGGDRP
ncbi:cytochrome P450 [Kribbella deserti]|uniref:Cytochrome P450 n=1 Tax=Kribbella deserti TaxID=1926257 RepID=A0ABV6R0A8_9ACTN